MNYYAGIDIGSTAIKLVVIDEEQNLLGSKVAATGALVEKNSMEAYRQLLTEVGLKESDISYLTTTGYGRKLIQSADETISEITANALGARKMGEEFGVVRTIINIGGQDTKAISLDEHGTVVNFAMNDRCAAGTGRFLDMAARNLEISVEQLGEFHFNAKGTPAAVNATCAVFAESEIIGLLGGGHSREEIVAGVHFSIAKRTIRLTKRVGINDVLYFDGGPALNKGLVAAIEDELGKTLAIPKNPQVTTAFGAALQGQEVHLFELSEEREQA
ncbi:MAG: CoA activase [Gammaproteobacteria bacterium]|nr:MAG: CoA activase [Gammaproteobacteria bacterium]RLA21203.1 MAG: CoA activase [Gammaproteobacteria bacterium]